MKKLSATNPKVLRAVKASVHYVNEHWTQFGIPLSLTKYAKQYGMPIRRCGWRGPEFMELVKNAGVYVIEHPLRRGCYLIPCEVWEGFSEEQRLIVTRQLKFGYSKTGVTLQPLPNLRGVHDGQRSVRYVKGRSMGEFKE